MSGAGGGKNPEPDARQGQEAEAALLAMPQLTRDIFIARHFHGHSIADICRQTGLSQRQVMGHLRRAVDHLCMAFPVANLANRVLERAQAAALRSRAELAPTRAGE
jgi:AraC-like DNA-binding protein